MPIINRVHIAVTLKKLITIFLLFALVGHAVDYFHTIAPEVSYFQEADEKCEKNDDEKKVKDCILSVSAFFAALQQPTNIDGYFCVHRLSPVLDLLQPPPDLTRNI